MLCAIDACCQQPPQACNHRMHATTAGMQPPRTVVRCVYVRCSARRSNNDGHHDPFLCADPCGTRSFPRGRGGDDVALTTRSGDALAVGGAGEDDNINAGGSGVDISCAPPGEAASVADTSSDGTHTPARCTSPHPCVRMALGSGRCHPSATHKHVPRCEYAGLGAQQDTFRTHKSL